MKPLHLFLLLAFVVTACSPISTPVSLATLPETTPLGTNTPFFTKIPDTPIPVSTNTPTSIPTKEISWPVSDVPSCKPLKIFDSLPSDYSFSGAVLSQERPPYFPDTGFGKFSESGLQRFDALTKVGNTFIQPSDYQEKNINAVRVGIQDLSISPDFRKAVYLVDVYTENYINSEPEKSWLEIYDSTSNNRTRLPWKDEWTYLIGWVNSDLFALRAGGSTLFLDSTGSIKKQFLASKYPDFSNPREYNPDVFVLWGGYRALGNYSFESKGVIGSYNEDYRDMIRLYNPTLETYSPSLEYVIYTEVKDRKPGIVLYDIKSKQKIIEIMTGQKIRSLAFGGVPVWSPDSKQALMLLPNEQNIEKQDLFLLDISGKIEKITSFDLTGPYSWSPDGKLIAFWLDYGRQIAVMNLETKTLKVFCLGKEYVISNFGIASDGIMAGGDIFWLPNDNQILAQISKGKDGGIFEGIGLIDLEKSLLVELEWNAEYPGWLEK